MCKRQTIIYLGLIIFSIGLSGCFRWAARGVNKLPDETALSKTYDYQGKVLIIGAGASGLAAAKVLEQNNIDYLILEATDRYGGRLKKDTTLADFPIDLGAEWLHSAPVTLNKLKGQPGNEIHEKLIPYRLETTASWDGEEYKKTKDWYNNFAYKFLPESKFKTLTWYDFVNENIAKTVKHKIQFNSVVMAIDYSGDKVVVVTKDGRKYEADRVLLTVSMGVLKANKISFLPEMDEEKKKAIESITFHPGFKAAMKFNKKFYPDAVVCEVEDGEKGFYDIAFKKDTEDNILGFLCTGSASQQYYQMESEEEIIDDLMKELDHMFDGQATASYSGEYRLENWGQEEHTLGTWTQAFQEKKSHLKILNQPLNDKVFFAGEIYDIYQQMGVPGAILSGYYAIDLMLTLE